MTQLTRRGFLGAAATALAAPRALGQGMARVVVIGGGAGGATAARTLAASGIEVTLVEPKRRYLTCFFSNHYLAGLGTRDGLGHGYEALARMPHLNIIHDTVAAIDPEARAVTLAQGTKLPYDRLVLAPGIDYAFEALEGHSAEAAEIMPHAWMAGPQSGLLRRQLESMADGGVFIIVVPSDPFRCPPAPYERASLVAHYFKQMKPRSKILILDAKDNFKGQDLFEDAWARHYPGMIEWLPKQFTGGVTGIDATSLTIKTAGGSFKADVANVIPKQMAGGLARQAGLADRSGWCPIDPETFESKLHPGIHLVGDAIIGGDMPKSAFSANSQAKACAFAIAAALNRSDRFAYPLFNTCYTFLAPDDAYSNAISFRPEAGKLKAVKTLVSKVGESPETRRRNAAQAADWYAAFTRDLFG
jgi:NADPH-dependent 2,4-dienoyl-CoA reductase/sulfur reductase-like enzyme